MLIELIMWNMILLTVHCEKTYTILENLPPGTYIENILIPSDKNEPYSLSPYNATIKAKFSINDNGDLFSSVSFDREQKSNYVFYAERSSLKLPIIVNIGDVNDNPPMISNAESNTRIEENKVLKDALYLFSFTDLDAEMRFKESNFSLINNFDKFILEKVSFYDVKLKSLDNILSFDREEQENYTLTIVAINTENISLSCTKLFTVIIDDVNDNFPEILNGSVVTIYLLENVAVNTSLGIISAQDQDKDQNARLSYRITDVKALGFVYINPDSGELRITATFDYEMTQSLTFMVFVADNGIPDQKTSSCRVDIVVEDMNDNAPVFSAPVSTFNIIENQPQFNNSLSLSDADSRLNQLSNFTLSNYTFFFLQIWNNVPFLILNTSLDRELQDTLTFFIVARNLASPFYTSSNTILIEIEDVNDNAPVFEQSHLKVDVDETDKVDSLILQYQATDADKTAKFNTISYLFSSGHAYQYRLARFGSQFRLFVRNTFNFSSPPSDFVTITATDQNRNNPITFLTANLTVEIVVHRQNKFTPKFNQSVFLLTLAENTEPPEILTTFSATDQDGGSESVLRYELVNADLKKFTMNSSTGELGVLERLDREMVSVYSFLVTATDSGKIKRTASAIVTVQVRDENDNAPIFDQPVYYLSVSEDTPVPKQLLLVRATDLDEGVNGFIRYQFLPNISDEASKTFYLDPGLGYISVIRPLDRETVASYNMTLIAQDQGSLRVLSGTATLVVTVTDVNDNPPIWLRDSQVNHSIEENRVDSTRYELMATDLDLGDNASIVYEIRSVSPQTAVSYFQFGQTSISPSQNNRAWLQLISPVDYEGLPSSRKYIQLSILAKSGDLVAVLLFTVTIIDVNDNPPTIAPFIVYILNYENRIFASPLGSVPADDVDTGSELRFQLPRSELQPVSINETNGRLSINQMMLGEIDRNYTVTVNVSDGKYSVERQFQVWARFIDAADLGASIKIVLDHSNSSSLERRTLAEFVRSYLASVHQQLADVLAQSVRYRIVIVDLELLSLRSQFSLSVTFFLDKGNPIRLAVDLVQELILQKLSMIGLFIVIPQTLSGICQSEPCADLQICRPSYRFSSMVPLEESSGSTVIMNTIRTETSAVCVCPPNGFGLTADWKCEAELNPCQNHRCSNNSTCVPIEGGSYKCECEASFGQFCEYRVLPTQSEPPVIVLATDSLPFSSNLHCAVEAHLILLNHTSTSSSVTSFQCTDCPYPVTAASPDCRLIAVTFSRGPTAAAFVSFNLPQQRQFLNIQLEILTTKPNCLLLYRGSQSTPSADFFSLELRAGELVFSVNLGDPNTTHRLWLRRRNGFSDGRQHRVSISLLPSGAGSISKSSSRMFLHTTEAGGSDDCDWGVHFQSDNSIDQLRLADIWPCSSVLIIDLACASPGKLCRRFLDSTGLLYVGGLPARIGSRLPQNTTVTSYEGCLRNLKYNGQVVNFKSALQTEGIVIGCVNFDLPTACQSLHCSAEHPCEVLSSSVRCRCNSTFLDSKCRTSAESSTKIVTVNLQTPQLIYRPGVAFIASGMLVNLYVLLHSRSQGYGLTLMRVTLNDTVELEVSLVVPTNYQSQTLQFSVGRALEGSNTASANFTATLDVAMLDSMWHRVELSISTSKIELTLDDNTLSNDVTRFDNYKLNEIQIGGSKFQGMVANFYSSYPVDLATKSASLQPLEKTNSVAYSTCQNTTRGLQCVCDSGFTLHGGLCEPVCGGSRTFTPCTWVDRSASCTVVSSSVQCGCTRQSGFYGRYCFWHLAMAPCRPNWWGSSLCWPCRCDAAAGFLATCDQKSGNCLCANDFYNRSNTCTGCNCDPEGSISNGCSSEGNCSCYNQYIVGQRCDQCLDHLAEVTNKLCQVFRGYCPRHWRFGIQWQRSRFGEEVSQKCPLGFLGTATRICNFDAGWMEPNVDNCIADSFQVLIDRVKPLLLGEVQVSPQTLLDLIRSLSSILSARTKPEIKLDLADRLTLYPLEVAIIARSLQLLFNPLQMILTAQLIGGVSNFDSNLATVAQAAFVYSPAASWIRLHQLLERPEANKMLGVVPLCCRFWDLFHQLELFSSRLSGIIPTMFDIGLNVSIDKIVFFVYKHQPSNKTSSFLNISKSINFSKLQESKNIVISINSSLIQSKNSDSTTVSVIILEKVAISPNLSINTNGSSVVNSVVINLESSGVSMRNRSDGFVQLRFPLFNATNGSLITHRCVYLDSALNIINQTEYSWVSSSNLCESIVSPDRATVECRCYHMSTYTVVSTTMLSSPIIPIVLPVTLYVLLSIAFAISFVSLAVLTPLLHLRYLRLGLAFNFHLNISLFILTFLTGINKINSDKNWCLVAGMVLHFSAVSGSTLAVLLLLHTYRRLRIRANAADRDQTLLLYLLAAYAPILIIVFGTVVAATAVYTDSARCWMALPTVSAPTGATWAVMVPLALIVLMALALAVLLTVCFLRYGCAYNSQNVSKRNTSSTAGQSQPAPAAAPSKPTIMKKYFSRVNWNMGITANTADPPPQFKNNSVISPVLFYQQHRRFLADFHLVKLKQFLPLLGCGLLIPCGCLLLLCGAGLSQASVDLLNSGLDILTAASVIMLLGVVSAVLGTVIFDDIVACSWISLVANRGRFDEMLRCSYFDKKEFGDSVISGEIKIPDNTHINLGENGIFNMGFLQDLPSESSSSAESE